MEEAKASSPASNKKIMIIGGIVAGLILIALIVVGAFLVLGNRATTGGANGLGFDTTQPEAAEAALNQQMLDSLEDYDPQALANLDFSAILNQYGGADAEALANSEFTIKMTIDGPTSAGINLVARTQVSDGKYAFSAKGDLTLDYKNEEVAIPLELMLVDEVLYFQIEELPAELAGDSSLASLSIFIGKWWKVSLSEYGDLITQSISEAYAEDMESIEEERQEAIDKLKTNPVFTNAKSASDRQLEGITLKCMTITMDLSNYLSSEELASNSVLPTEICAHNGTELPTFLSMTVEQTIGDIESTTSLFTVGLGHSHPPSLHHHFHLLARPPLATSSAGTAVVCHLYHA